MMWDTSSMGWSWGFGLLAIAFIALIVYVVVRSLSKTPGGEGPPSTDSSLESSDARHILDERFARGELTAEQYRDHLRILGEDR
ncbi:hypothetical protein GY21_15240 [Cryobacterium roopkundense]|uniref:Putative membrane protein n=1 Tax=Cryobacterium roopkundense TaxID=1001240 RepID=A0A099J1Y6_9MICO|nr:hypothetical protein [Cryobacterium roopkundense]KGJ72439.1 hypothetical protein GY21_15240 [Cryobacterium roopkundense]MBB5641083.1 putative membrane protein [Cryobacterium roopkundense]